MSWLKFTFGALSLTMILQAAPQNTKTVAQKTHEATKKAEHFKPFTGKIVANKVRLRVKPDTDSHVLRQANKNDLLLIIGEIGDFYAISPPKGTKSYVFRSYILDNVVEANRVNIRLEPHVDGPIIGQLQSGDKVQGTICPLNHKWLEIPPPANTRFYVSKEFIENAGGPEYLTMMEKRKTQVEELLNTAFMNAEAECKKSYEEMSPQPIIEQLQLVLKTYSDFPEAVAHAKEALTLLKDTYLQKKINYLESKAELSQEAKNELLLKQKEEKQELFANTSIQVDPSLFSKRNGKKNLTDKMRFWETVEESLYLSWSAFHTGKKSDEFYAEQKANASILSGTIEPYQQSIKNKPGDYILRTQNRPVAYLYSTNVDLEKYVGKEVSLQASPRPNNHFAFPAYFVLEVE